PNSRMVQATFDDANPATVANWNYPGGAWDPSRNTEEFVQALPSYRARGLLAVTLNFQGGGPKPGQFSADQAWDNSAFDAAGNLKPAYLARMDRAIKALDANGMVAIVGYFYFGQVHRLSSAGASETDDPAVLNAVDQATDWLVSQNYRNVLVEIANESDNGYYSHPMIRPPAVRTLIERVRSRSNGRLLVSTSFTGGYDVPDAVLNAADFILIHGNNLNASQLTSYIRAVRSRTDKPIVINEDSASIENFKAATAERVSWGYYDQGANDHVNGFQSPPINWAINTPAKMAFFDQIAAYTGAGAPRTTGLTLINADTNLPLEIPGTSSAAITDNTTIDLGALPTRNLSIRAEASAAASVRFDYDATAALSVQNTPPFALAGHKEGAYNPWTPVPGPHVLTAAPYSEPAAGGTLGEAVTVRFRVVDSAGVSRDVGDVAPGRPGLSPAR
ncbi:MAG TPA: hypothetical protein VN428_08425, partial [Bryobacteraceae bacterium]|nr:hypothetical protein [Bryobacteraceae bacterium]